MITLNESGKTRKYALFQLGFRPFFLGAALFALLSSVLWFAQYSFGLQSVQLALVGPVQWHAHEMVFGYSLAVIAGFLLTAARNWTNLQTLQHAPLATLFFTWALARVLALFAATPSLLWATILLDLAFNFFLTYAIAQPILQAKQWNNIGLVSKVLLLSIANLVFYAGVLDNSSQWRHVGLYAGLYLVLAIVLTLGRRVMPFFIERGVTETVSLPNWKWVDLTSLILFLGFAITDLVSPTSTVTALFAVALTVLHTIRLTGWHTPGIWKKPLLWILFLAYAFIITGFALKAASIFWAVPVFLAIHAFTYGGIGLITLGMMARVALGHTGRNVFDPPPILHGLFILITCGACFRVFFPLIFPAQYTYGVAFAFIFWILAFAGFLYTYIPILIRPRIDGQPG